MDNSITYKPNINQQTYRVLNLYRLTGIQTPQDPMHLYRYRLIQRAGFVRMRSDNPEWFQDHRYLPQQQAQYLKKLSRLREELIMQQQSVGKGDVQHSTPRRDTSTNVRQDVRPSKGFPERHKKLQNARKDTIANARRTKTPPKLNTLAGQPIIDRDSSRMSKSMDNLSMDLENYPASEPPPLKLPYLTSPSLGFLSSRTDLSYEAVNEVIETQRTRLKEIQNVPLSKPSIPQPAHKLGPVNSFERGRTHESFVRQIPMSKKNNRGLCRGKTNVNTSYSSGSQFMRADADEIQLPQDFYDLALADSTGVGTQAPPTTPNWHKYSKDPEYIRTLEEQKLIHVKFHIPNAQQRGVEPHHFATEECVFCDQEQNKSNEISKSQTATNNDGNRKQGCRVTFENPESETSSTKRHIVVDLPDTRLRDSASSERRASVPHLVVRSPSPQKHFVINTDVRKSSDSLIKTFKQNELREKEIKNLLEDVKELNMLSESFAAET